MGGDNGDKHAPAASADGGVVDGNIDRAGVVERYRVGIALFVVAVAATVGIVVGVQDRWWRLFVFPLFTASFSTGFQGTAKC